MQATMPKTRPQCTSMPGMLPIMLASPSGGVDGLFRLAGSRIAPSTMWLRMAMPI